MNLARISLTFFGLGLFPLAGVTEASGGGAPVERNGRHDFDFLFGTYQVSNRVLVKRLAGSTDWTTFEATNVGRPLLGGLANIDEFRPKTWRPGYVGSALRLFNPQTQKWSIHWMDSRRGVVDPPVVGQFHGEVGVFEGEDEWEGRPIRVRFTWTRNGRNSARWEQAFSADQGKNWEVNWIMDFTRSEPAPIEAPGKSSQGTASQGSQGFDFLLGQSQVANRILEARLENSRAWTEFAAVATGQPILNGLGVIEDFSPTEGRPGFLGLSLRLYNPATQKWSLYWADNRRGALDGPVVGEFKNEVGIFEGQGNHNGHPVLVRANVTRIGPNLGRWEQAFSPDQGNTWETNWTMEFSPSQKKIISK